MNAKVSEQALAECRGALEVGSPMDFEDGAVDALQQGLRPSFEAVLDKTGGDLIWKRDRAKMLMQSAAVGTLASVFTTILPPSGKKVPSLHLRLAFEFVKAGCDLIIGADADPRTKYCEAYPVPPEYNRAFWVATLERKA